MSEQDLLEIVDEMADTLDPTRVEAEAERFGITPEDLIDRVAHELKSRLQ